MESGIIVDHSEVYFYVPPPGTHIVLLTLEVIPIKFKKIWRNLIFMAGPSQDVFLLPHIPKRSKEAVYLLYINL